VAEAAAARLRRVLEQGQAITIESLRAATLPGHELRELRDGEPDVTYEALFRDKLAGAEWIRIVDPYVRKSYQIGNLEAFVDQVGVRPGCRLELVTMFEQDERYGLNREEESRRELERLRTRWADEEVEFAYRFDPAIHDRYIESPQWRILLGRGLDIYYPPDFSPRGEYLGRRARRTTIVYLPQESRG